MAEIDNLSIRVTASADEAARTFDRLASSAGRLRGVTKGTADGLRDMADAAKDNATEISKVADQSGRAWGREKDGRQGEKLESAIHVPGTASQAMGSQDRTAGHLQRTWNLQPNAGLLAEEGVRCGTASQSGRGGGKDYHKEGNTWLKFGTGNSAGRCPSTVSGKTR